MAAAARIAVKKRAIAEVERNCSSYRVWELDSCEDGLAMRLEKKTTRIFFFDDLRGQKGAALYGRAPAHGAHATIGICIAEFAAGDGCVPEPQREPHSNAGIDCFNFPTDQPRQSLPSSANPTGPLPCLPACFLSAQGDLGSTSRGLARASGVLRQKDQQPALLLQPHA